MMNLPLGSKMDDVKALLQWPVGQGPVLAFCRGNHAIVVTLFVSFSVWEAACLVFSAWLEEVVR